MDLLDRVAEPAADLLDRVDALLAAHGAPADHPVWKLLRRVGVMPGDAVAQISALAPDSVRSAAEPLIKLAEDCRSAVAGVPGEVASQGLAAQGYTARWSDLSRQVADPMNSANGGGLDARALSTSAYLGDVADWAALARRALAGELGACLGSAEAVTVRMAVPASQGAGLAGAPDPAAIAAAAEIATHVLAVIAQSIDEGWQIQQRWASVQTETPIRAIPTDVSVAHHIDVR